MADSKIYQSKDNGYLYIQPGRPGTRVYGLPCYDLEDIAQSNGGITLIQCINEFGQYETLGATVAPPEPTTTTLGTYLGEVAEFMEYVQCPFGLYITLGCGKKGVFDSWERAMLVDVRAVTNINYSGLVRKEEDVPAMVTFDIEGAAGMKRFYRLSSAPQSIDSGVAGSINSMRFSDDISCWSSCGETSGECEKGIAVTTGGTAATANVLLSPEFGGTSDWAATAADPFAVAEDIADGIIVKTGRDTDRIIVVRGTTDAGNPMEIAWSDDLGATWNLVDVGTDDGEFAVKKGALTALSSYDIYLASNSGRIYKSEDGGLSWAVKEDANITTSAYNAIVMFNPNIGYAVGTSGLVVKTIDGGKTWGQTGGLAGSADLYAVEAISTKRIIVGSTLGITLESTDGGESWTSTQHQDATANVNDISAMDQYYIGIANGETYQFTINGGFSWDTVSDTTNLHSSDIVSINICSTRKVFNVSTDTIVQSTQ